MSLGHPQDMYLISFSGKMIGGWGVHKSYRQMLRVGIVSEPGLPVPLQQRAERTWTLELLRQGLRDQRCFNLYDRRGVLRVLLAFFDSPLCEPSAQVGPQCRQGLRGRDMDCQVLG